MAKTSITEINLEPLSKQIPAGLQKVLVELQEWGLDEEVRASRAAVLMVGEDLSEAVDDLALLLGPAIASLTHSRLDRLSWWLLDGQQFYRLQVEWGAPRSYFDGSLAPPKASICWESFLWSARQSRAIFLASNPGFEHKLASLVRLPAAEACASSENH